jgi:hypothetical protein
LATFIKLLETVSKLYKRVLWRMAIILKANKVNLFVSSVLFVFCYHSPNVLDTLHKWNISWLRVKVTLSFVTSAHLRTWRCFCFHLINLFLCLCHYWL